MNCFSFAGIALLVTACASSVAPPPAPRSPQASAPVFDAIHARDPVALARVLDGDSRLASAHDGDGISATLAALFELVVSKGAAGKRALTIRDVQHEYVFDEL